MRIGFVYDAREDYRALGFSEEAVAEFDTPETLAAIEAALACNGHAVEAVGHGRALAGRLACGARWDLVFSIAEGVAGRSREAQVPALCELFDQPYAFSDPLTMAATLDKAVAKRLVRDAGVATAPFAVIERAADAAQVTLPFPVFAKPLAEGTGKGCETASKAVSRQELERIARRLIARFAQPVIAEPFLPGREFTVGVLGNGATARVVGVLEVALRDGAEADAYSLANKEHCEDLVDYALADDAEARKAGVAALRAYHALGCRDAARIDLRSDAMGEPMFLEVNPLAGLHPTHSDLPILAAKAGVAYEALIAGIVDAAAARYGLDRRGAAARRAV
ncbi:MAG: D-alanine--D-alanine ligase [Rhodospirillales bacterium]|nr:D-alanine--D-alanine ligase [Rhodospirillales bacterium]